MIWDSPFRDPIFADGEHGPVDAARRGPVRFQFHDGSPGGPEEREIQAAERAVEGEQGRANRLRARRSAAIISGRRSSRHHLFFTTKSARF